MKIGYAQFDCQIGDKKYNLNKIASLAAKAKADLIVFPELSVSGYMVANKKELASLAEPILGGPSVKYLVNVAKKNNIVLIASLPEIKNKKFYISAVAVGPKGYITHHQKTHLFLREKKLFTPGTTRPHLLKWKEANIGIGVCYDYMFPEFWRALALLGADIFCNTANYVFNYGFKMMQARALENGVITICTNRIGLERGQTFKGGSEIVDERGNILLKATSKEEVGIVDINPFKSRNKSWNDYNNLIEDRRPKLYFT